MRSLKKALAVALALSLSLSAIGFVPSARDKVYAEETATNNIAVDINGSENRGNLKSPMFADWTLTGKVSPSSFQSGNVKFILSTSTGKSFSKCENKTLISGDNTPYLTTDGAFYDVDGASIILEITGLSAGTHNITTWHSYFNEPESKLGELGKLAILVD